MFAELYSIINSNGTLVFRNGAPQLQIECKEISLLKKTAALIRDLFDGSISIDIIEKSIFKKKRIFRGIVKESEVTISIMKRFGYGEICNFSSLNREILGNDCCISSFLRGIFLSHGYISEPGINYNLEFTFSDQIFADLILELLNKFHIFPHIQRRNKNTFILYVRTGDEISKFLALTGATNSLLKFENHRAIRATRGDVNRLNNFDMANIGRISTGSTRHIQSIKKLQRCGKLEELSEELQNIARLRIENPYISLSELGKLCLPPLSKGAIAYRMRKLQKLSEEVEKCD